MLRRRQHQCKVDGGSYYNNSGQDVVAANGQVLSAGGCYQAETCASSPFPDVIDQVARWSCRNDAFLDAAQDAAEAVAVVAGVIVLAPVSAGVVLAGAGVGLVLSPWTCDQSDNGWYAPATSFSDVSSSCVATEVSLGAIFAPIGGTGATATLGRAIAVGCVEGGTSTAVYGYQNPETEIDPGNVARLIITLTDAGLSSPQAALNTIAHELNHIREILNGPTGHFIQDEAAATTAGDLAEAFFR